MLSPKDILGRTIESRGIEALYRLECAISEGVSSAIPLQGGEGLNIFGRRAERRVTDKLSFLAGLVGAGLRGSAFLNGEKQPDISGLAQQQLAALVYHISEEQDGKGQTDLQHSHPASCFRYQPTNLQEAIDFALIAHRVAELALLPGLCIMDGLAYAIQQAEVPAADVLRSFLGQPDTPIESPTPAQRLVFGKNRRRIPQWYSFDAPTMEAARKEHYALSLEGAARERYFNHHLPEIVLQVMEEYGRLTGRHYTQVKAVEAQKAGHLVLVQGTAFEVLADAANQFYTKERARVGALSLSIVQPFPKAELLQLLTGKKGITILQQASQGDPADSYLYRQVKAAIQPLGKRAPALYAGAYVGPLSREAALAVFKNSLKGAAPRSPLYLGFDYTRTASSFPQHEVMLQAIAREYPGIEKETINFTNRDRAIQDTLTHSPPFAIRRYQDQGPPYARLSRFYQNTACFYQQGSKAELVADPFQALPIVPAATANFANPPTKSVSLPVFEAQNCSGCAACIAYCPHSAMPSVAINLQSLLRSGMKIAANQSTPIPQLMALERKLVKIAETLLKEDGQDIRRIADFLPIAFERLVEEGKLEGEKLEKAREGIEVLQSIIGPFPIAVTEAFYHQNQRQEKGAAQLFSIAIDPHACTGCGLCVDVCEDDALHMTPVEEKQLSEMEATLSIWEQLPDTPSDTINQLIREPAYNPIAATLLSRHFYLSMSGGSTTEEGAPAKTVLHWLTAILESVMQPKVEQQAKMVEEQLSELSKNIHQQLSNALPKKEFNLSADTMAALGEGKHSLEDVIHSLGMENPAQAVNTEELRRKIELQNELKAMLWAMREGPTGGGRARYGVLLTDKEALPWADDYPYNPFTAPVLWNWGGASPERLIGMLNGHKRHVLDQLRLLRRAALEVKNKYKPEIHDEEIGKLQWEAISDEEKQLLPPLLLVGSKRLFSDESRVDILELLSSGQPVKLLVLDDAVTSPGQPWLAAQQATLAAALSLPQAFLLKARLGDSQEAFEALREGLQQPGPALFHLLAPDSSQHTDAETLWPEKAMLALQSRAFPNLTFRSDSEARFLSSVISLEGNPALEQEWGSTVLKYDQDKEQTYLLTFADWLFRLKDWKGHFHLLETEEGGAVPVAEYLSLDAQGQKSKMPVITIVDEQQQLQHYVVSEEVITATRHALQQWNRLRELAGIHSPFPQKMREELEHELTEKYEKELSEMKASYEEQLRKQEAELMERTRIKLRDKLLQLSKRGKKVESQS